MLSMCLATLPIATRELMFFQASSTASCLSTGTSKSRPEAECTMTLFPFFTTLPKGLPRAVRRYPSWGS